MNKRRQLPLWLIAVILPPIVSAILGAIYDWEIAGAAALLGLLLLPATLLFTALRKSTISSALLWAAVTGILIGFVLFGLGAIPLVQAEEAAISLARFCLILYLASLGVSLFILSVIRARGVSAQHPN
jgi:hypothetical protein